jgi:hypothetical protein
MYTYRINSVTIQRARMPESEETNAFQEQAN